MVIQHWTWKFSLRYVAKSSQSSFSSSSEWNIMPHCYMWKFALWAFRCFRCSWAGSHKEDEWVSIAAEISAAYVSSEIAARTNCRFWYASKAKKKCSLLKSSDIKWWRNWQNLLAKCGSRVRYKMKHAIHFDLFVASAVRSPWWNIVPTNLYKYIIHSWTWCTLS